MKNKKINAVHVWKELEDLLVPRLHLSVFDRAVYSHLLRHSRLEGRLQLRFSILWLARGACLSGWAARKAVRSLVAKGALRLAERSKAGHVVMVCLPEEIRSVRAGKIAARAAERLPGVGRVTSRRRISWKAGAAPGDPRARGRDLLLLLAEADADAAVPRPCGARVRGGRNGYRNLVSSRSECNSQKGERRADDFLRWLCREGRLSAGNSAGGCALAKLAAGKAATCFACAGQASGQTLKCKPKKEIRNLEKGEEKKSAGVASLRGQGTPAYPARLRSERARNSSRNFRAATVTKLGKSLCCRNS